MRRRRRRRSSFEIGAAGLQSEIRHPSFSIISKLFGEGTVGGMSAVSLVLCFLLCVSLCVKAMIVFQGLFVREVSCTFTLVIAQSPR